MSFVKRAKKTVVAVLAFAATCVSAGVFDDEVEAIVLGVLALAGSVGVYQARNEKAVADGGVPRV